MEQSGDISMFNIPGTLFRIFPRTSLGTSSQYTGDISWECSTNFHEHIFARWAGISIGILYFKLHMSCVAPLYLPV